MKKILILLALWPFLVFGQMDKETRKAFDREVKEFKQNAKDPDFIGVLPGENPSFVRNLTLSPQAANSWGTAFVGGGVYRQAIAKAAKREIFVSVFDTGLPDHNDLKAVTLFGKNFVAGEGGGLLDGHGHATHVGGTIAGNPQGGLIAPAAGLVDAGKIKIKFYKVLANNGSGSIVDIYNAAKADLEDCRKRIEEGGFCVWNYSLGGGTTGYTPLNQVFDEAAKLGVLIFCANGNSSGRGVNYPGNYPTNFAIAAAKQVGNTIERDSYSTYGPESFAIEPGSSILSTLTNQSYGSWSGTSMATPHAVSIAAVVASINPTWNAAQVIAHMRTKAQDLPPTGRDENNGWGYHLFAKLLESTPPPPPPNPTCTAPTTAQVSAKSVSSSGAILNSTVSADNYQFRYGVLNSGSWIETGWKGNNVVITSLKPGIIYEVQCKVKCGAIESGYSPSVAFKTLPAPANPVKPYSEWKVYAMPPTDNLYMYWQVDGQQQSQTTKITNISIKVLTNGYEWAQDEVMAIVYGFFGPNRGFYLRVNDDNETAVRWAAHFLLNELKSKLGTKYGMQFQIDRICGETPGGSIGVRYCDIRNFVTPLASEQEVKTFEK
jgi:hypothetical protein